MEKRVALRLPGNMVERVEEYRTILLRKRPGSTINVSDVYRELIARGLADVEEEGELPRETPPRTRVGARHVIQRAGP